MVRIPPTLQDFFHQGGAMRIDAELEDDARFEKARDCRKKGGIGSALARKLKTPRSATARLRHCCPIACPGCGKRDHSHSHKSLPEGEANSADPPKQGSAARGQEPSIAVSPELAAYVARRTT
jgi:hypothetical protein